MFDIDHFFWFTKNKGIMGADKKTVGIMLEWFWMLWVRVTAPSLCQMFPAPLAKAAAVDCASAELLCSKPAVLTSLWFHSFSLIYMVQLHPICRMKIWIQFHPKGVQVTQTALLWTKAQKMGTIGQFALRAPITLTTAVMETHSQQVTINNMQQPWRQMDEKHEIAEIT